MFSVLIAFLAPAATNTLSFGTPVAASAAPTATAAAPAPFGSTFPTFGNVFIDNKKNASSYVTHA